MQKDFLDEDRPISLEGGKAIIPSVIKAVEVARELGILVVWVTHSPFSPSLTSLSVLNLLMLMPALFSRKIFSEKKISLENIYQFLKEIHLLNFLFD